MKLPFRFLVASLHTAAALLVLGAGAMLPANGVLAQQTTTPPAPTNQDAVDDLQTNVDEVIDNIIREFDDATGSLDTLSNRLDDALSVKSYEEALGVVDELIGKVNKLADYVKPGNSTSVRIAELVAVADAVIAQIQADDAQSADFKASRLKRLNSLKERMKAGESELSGFHPELAALAEELKNKQNSIAYDVIISTIAAAADQLDATNEKIRTLIDKLKTYLNTIKEPLTN